MARCMDIIMLEKVETGEVRWDILVARQTNKQHLY